MDTDAFANRLADENLKKEATPDTNQNPQTSNVNDISAENTKVNVTAYMGDQPIIGGIKVNPKEKFNLFDRLHIKFNKKTIPIIAITAGLLLIIIATGGYFVFNGYLGRSNNEPEAPQISANNQNTKPQVNYLQVTYGNKQLPNSIIDDPFINDVANINSTSSFSDTLARFINLPIRDINYELKNIQIQSPE